MGRPRFGLFEAANWIGEILSRDEDKGKELPEAEFVGLASGHRVALSPDVADQQKAQNKAIRVAFWADILTTGRKLRRAWKLFFCEFCKKLGPDVVQDRSPCILKEMGQASTKFVDVGLEWFGHVDLELIGAGSQGAWNFRSDLAFNVQSVTQSIQTFSDNLPQEDRRK